MRGTLVGRQEGIPLSPKVDSPLSCLLWIAATAHVTGATILTTDRDFDPLHGLFLQRDWVDPASRL